jgi:hypothetical protein
MEKQYWIYCKLINQPLNKNQNEKFNRKSAVNYQRVNE